jgi:NAD(P)-dependent dehydrogenase (short-subunit alcohol dehydrogenase family)
MSGSPRSSRAAATQWNSVIGVNLTGQFLCARAAVREFLRRGIVPQWRDASVADPSSGAAAMTDCDGTSDCRPSTASMPRQAILAMLE